ncbi:MAG: 4-alpha-glucanotransferase [Spirochaetales bacterium]|nr:4-alpha-glucanotransferase [Spirochaetales bacterium]
MGNQRRSGVLLHPTSLPGPYGIGDLGSSAYEFVDFLEKSGQTLWQVLPLGPTGYGDSPYASFSTFAGNPLLISLDSLVSEGWLSAENLGEVPAFDPAKIDYGWVIWWKMPLLDLAAKNFLSHASGSVREDYERFLKEEASWLDDFALFMAVKEEFQKKAEAEGAWGKMWSNFWDRDIRLKEAKAEAVWRKKLSPTIEIKKVLQFWFFRQWLALRTYANQKGVQIVGDIPIFVAADSVDVWANREAFLLNEEGEPRFVAGVPPDYFSATGQLWGNPLYNWDYLRATGFAWWIKRIQAILKLVDIIRIDHFRGFEAYWEIPFGAPNAIKGRWVKAPGMELFAEVKRQLGQLPILAEDLGVITPEVEQMRDAFAFPGMKILQFAFDSNEAGASGNNPFLPHNYSSNCVVYTGSHDNDTIRGWWEAATPDDQKYSRDYIHDHSSQVAWGFIRAALASTAVYAVIPAQDLLDLPSWARMNTPSTLGGNWAWRLTDGQLSEALAKTFKDLTRLYGR